MKIFHGLLDMQRKNIFSSRYIFHYFLWLLLTLSLALDSRWLFPLDKRLFLFYVITKTIFWAAVVYLNILWLYPAFYKRRKYLTYAGFIFIIALTAGMISLQVEEYLTPRKILGNTTEHFLFFLSQLITGLQYIFFSFLLKITVDYYVQKETLKKIELEKTTAELNFLKAQVNPHFLFNTLNNIYALIIEKSENSGEAVLRLADIMKYILAEGKEDKVMLQKEIQLLYNYTELERLRKPYSEIRLGIYGNTEKLHITPLLLLPLVENSFKYGLNSVAKNGFVRIDIKAAGKNLLMHIENNIPPVHDTNANESLGMGIDSVKQRLERLYKNKYHLEIKETEFEFIVDLQIELI